MSTLQANNSGGFTRSSQPQVRVRGDFCRHGFTAASLTTRVGWRPKSLTASVLWYRAHAVAQTRCAPVPCPRRAIVQASAHLSSKPETPVVIGLLHVPRADCW